MTDGQHDRERTERRAGVEIEKQNDMRGKGEEEKGGNKGRTAAQLAN